MSTPPIPQGESATDSRVANVIVGSFVPTALASIFTIARIYTRGVIIKNWGLDDTFIAIAWILSIVIAILNCSLTKFGVGHHAFTIPLSDVIEIEKITLPAQTLYQLTLFITKVGICLFYRRIFHDKWSKKLLYILIIFLTLEIIAAELMALLRCRPFSEFFNVVSSRCGSSVPVLYLNGLFNILVDLLLIGFAIPRILPLQMPQRQKIPLLCIASLGFLAVIAAALRLFVYLQANESPDFPYAGANIPVWSSIEVSTGLFCASAPCLRPLLRNMIPNFLSSISQTTVPTNGRMGAYASRKNRTMVESGRDLDDIEMQSENNLTCMDGKHGREAAVWTGKGGNTSDNESQVEVLRSDGNIVKTVSVRITNGEKADTSDVGRQRQAIQYEHV